MRKRTTQRLLICEICGKNFHNKYYLSNKIHRFCSKSCRDEYRKTHILERFLSKIDAKDENGCMLWTASKDKNGYGYFRVSTKRKEFAHRYSWEETSGKISDNLFVLHKCDNPSCVNPEHLFLGNHQDNMDDMSKKHRAVHGNKHHKTKLTEQEVREIRVLYQNNNSQRSLAAKFNVTKNAIKCIVNNKTWKHVI